jgi:hypothetical protein
LWKVTDGGQSNRVGPTFRFGARRPQIQEKDRSMKIRMRFRRMTAALASAVVLLPSSCLRAEGPTSSPQIGYEVVGQVLNPSPQTSQQYGYLNFVRGLERITNSVGAAVSASTALLTFFNDTTTQQVINSGPMRVVDRTGTGVIYFGTGNADFTNPATFKLGTAVQNYSLRHQVVIDTSTGYFTTTFEMTVTDVKGFEIDGTTYRLGHPGSVYRLTVFGKLTAQSPPSAYIAGLADGPGVIGTAQNH